MEATRSKQAVKAPKNSGPAKPKTKTTAPKQPKNPGSKAPKTPAVDNVPETPAVDNAPETPAIDKAPKTAAPKTSAAETVGQHTARVDPADQISELLHTQSEQGSAIRAMQSQMDTMALGMAACGSILKGARQKVDEHRELSESALAGSRTLADAIEELRQGRTSLQRLGTDVPHRMLESQLKTLDKLVNIGQEFTEVFTNLAADVSKTTEALAQWLQGDQADVEMGNGSEGEVGGYSGDEMGNGSEGEVGGYSGYSSED